MRRKTRRLKNRKTCKVVAVSVVCCGCNGYPCPHQGVAGHNGGHRCTGKRNGTILDKGVGDGGPARHQHGCDDQVGGKGKYDINLVRSHSKARVEDTQVGLGTWRSDTQLHGQDGEEKDLDGRTGCIPIGSHISFMSYSYSYSTIEVITIGGACHTGCQKDVTLSGYSIWD